jgi:phospholipid/cholesterol/gamma-HCH transport system substrate-binding protein
MNKRLRQNFLTGLAVILALAAVVVCIQWLSGTLSFNRNTHYTVIFDNVKGLSAGSIVQMAGVTIGKIDAVGLTRALPGYPDNKAQVDLSVNPPHQIPQGSKFLIISPAFGNPDRLTVEPNAEPAPPYPTDKPIVGSSSTGLDDLLKKSEPLIDQTQTLLATVQKSAEAAAKITNDAQTQRDLKLTMHNLAETTAQLPGLLRQSERQLTALSTQTQALLIKVNRAADSGQQIAANAEGLTGDLRATVRENRAGIKSLVQNASETASSFATLADNISGTIGNKDIQQNLATATENLAAITSRLDATAADLNRLSSDPRLSDDVRQTVSTVRETAENLRGTSQSIRNLASRVETIRIPGERRRPSEQSPATTPPPPRAFSDTSLLEPGLVFDTVYDTTVSRLRLDTNFTLLAGKPGSFYRLGIYDLTERNRLNLQIGSSSRLPANFALRYGIFAGKLGTGIDLRTGPIDLRLDAYDPNRFTLNARAKAYLNANTSITAGLDSIGKDNRATVGVQIRR